MTQSPEFDAVGEDYDAQVQMGLAATGEETSYFARERMRWIARRLSELGISPESVLDFGCGRGIATPFFFESLGTLQRSVGADISSRLLELARKEFASERSAFELITGEDDGSRFDLAYTSGVFHHIPPDQRREALDYVFRRLRPGGVFAFWEHNPWNPGTRYIMSRIPFDKNAITLSAPHARALLRDTGFEILRTDFLFIFPRFLGALRPLEHWVVGTPIGGQYLVLARRPR